MYKRHEVQHAEAAQRRQPADLREPVPRQVQHREVGRQRGQRLGAVQRLQAVVAQVQLAQRAGQRVEGAEGGEAQPLQAQRFYGMQRLWLDVERAADQAQR